MKIFLRIRLFIVILFAGLCIFVWYLVLAQGDEVLTVAFLDVGQGDAIYIEAPNGNQLMIDGGPGSAVLSRLSEVMPFYDRTIDVLLVSNPDSDHISGFVEVLKRFSVLQVIEPGTEPTTGVYNAFESAAVAAVYKVEGKEGQRIVLDRSRGVYFDVLFPDQDVSEWKTNDGSIIGKLTYGNTCFIFSGDAPQSMENYVTVMNGSILDCQVLKVGHHGSKTSSAVAFVSVVSPEYAVISSGKGNSYGHPHKETLETLNQMNVKILRTDELGTIILRSDGEKIIAE